MKRKHTALVLASACGLLLGGCSLEDIKNAPKSAWESTSNFFTDTWNKITGKKTEDEPNNEEEHHEEEHHEEEAPKVEITVFELPETLEIGGTLDLANYVSVVGADDYSVVLAEESKAIASVEGKVITASAEGEIKFEVVAGETKVSKSVVCAFGDRAKFVELTKDAGKNYTVLQIGYDEEDEYYLADMISHTDNYVLQQAYDIDYDAMMYIPGGYLTFTGEDCFEFNLTSSDGKYYDNVLVNPVPADPENLYLFNSEFTVDFSKAEYMYDEELECGSLVIRNDEAMIFAENSLMIEDGYFGLYTDDEHSDYELYYPSLVEFVYIEAEDGEPACLEAFMYTDIFSSSNELVEKESYYGQFELYFDEENIGMSVLDKFVADESNIPEFPNYAELSGLTGIFDSICEYKVATKFIVAASWVDKAGSVDEGTYYIDQPSELDDTYFRAASNILEAIYYAENGILSFNESGLFVSGKLLHGEPAAVYDLEVDDEGNYIAYENQSLLSPWEADEYDFSFLGSEGVLDFALNFVGIDEEYNYHFEILDSSKPYVFISLASLTRGLIPLESDLIQAYNSGKNLFKHFNTEVTLSQTGATEFVFELEWDDTVSYIISFSFDFGFDFSETIAYFESLYFPTVE